MTPKQASRVLATAAFLMATVSCGPKDTSSDDDTSTGDSSDATIVTDGSLTDMGSSSSATGSTEGSPTGSGDVPPESCVPKEFDDTEARKKCSQYVDVKSCCGAKSLASGTDGDEGIIPSCALSFDTKADGTPAPAECPQLVGAAFDCALMAATESCANLRHLVDAVWGAYDKVKGNQPPTDTSMPCHAEIIMAWDAGCEPNML